MAKNKAIIRRLSAVETLGSATYICSDKTGTLTQNKMTVTKILDAHGETTNRDFILTLACLCNNSYITDDVHGEPTENALIYAGIQNHMDTTELATRYKRLYEIPFDSKRKMMTTVHSLAHGTYRCITKGALDILLDRCTHYLDGPTMSPLDTHTRRKILELNSTMASDALRIIAVAYKDCSIAPPISNNNNNYRSKSSNVKNIEPNNTNETAKAMTNYEHNLCFVGLIGMIDPPRAETYDAVKGCKLSGVTPIMITGDHPLTAYAIAKDIGICRKKEDVITGKELDRLNDEELHRSVLNHKVYARVSPSHKVRIVKALQHNQQIVAMTGDGVNDAPALKAADIGCSMGLSGTDVAKDASDMILADDNFATIITAIKEGRGIYDNIRKAIHFLLSCNIGEIITILFAILFSLPTPLLAVQLLWINLVTDSLPAISLGVEPVSNSVMNRRRVGNGSFFTKSLSFKIVIEGFMIGLLALLAFIIGLNYSLTTGQTMAFAVLGLSQLFHSFNMKTDKPLLEINIFNNPKLILSFIICTFLQISVISIPTLAGVFKVAHLDAFQWIIVFVLSFTPIPLVELQKHILKQ